MERKGTYLKVGDQVYHKKFTHWGIGEVVEEWRSTLPGGLCFVKIIFQDGKKRVFDNSFESNFCCYYMGLIRFSDFDLT